MAYNDKVLDHNENPRNVGAFDKTDLSVGTGLVGAPACGDVMKLQIKVNAAGIIEDAKFKTFGCGAAIAASSGFKTVSDLRAIDIAYRGQGAPIVPIGDRLLFSEYDAWLNIGGIANITLKNNDKYIAYDIASANQILNHYTKKLGKDFDDNGFIASTNKVQIDCFKE